jgi:thiamine pyrophosphokinase
MLALIFANGVLNQPAQLQSLLDRADIIIAADGGANHCAELAITPDILLGDFDSIDADVLAAYKAKDVETRRYPVQKDATDLELALDQAKEMGADTVWLLGALGGRWDMSFANVLLGGGEKYKSLLIFLLGEDCSMHILHPGKSYPINGKAGDKVSFLPLKGDVCGVTLTNFEYPLQSQTIHFGSSLAISNVLRSDHAMVQLTKGILLCIVFFDE